MGFITKTNGTGISKTKLAALIGGIGLFAGGLASLITGDLGAMPFVVNTVEIIAAVMLAFGIRDLPLLNKA